MELMSPGPICTDRINCFAVVSYIPEPLAGFLDELRQELVPNCFLRAHITILPPRPSTATPEADWRHLSGIAQRFRPFEMELKAVEVFPISDVIYVSVGQGAEWLRSMHEAMDFGGLCYKERYAYHPHVTLAQDLKPDEFDELIQVARRRWTESKVPRTFRVEKITFVQSSSRKTWIDLNECPLLPESQPQDQEEDQRVVHT